MLLLVRLLFACVPAAVIILLLCAGLEDVEPKAHLIVVVEREAFKLRSAEVKLEAEPPLSTDLNPSSN